MRFIVVASATRWNLLNIAVCSLAADPFAAAGDADGLIKLDDVLTNALYKVVVLAIMLHAASAYTVMLPPSGIWAKERSQ